jgi:hypothetical protein
VGFFGGRLQPNMMEDAPKPIELSLEEQQLIVNSAVEKYKELNIGIQANHPALEFVVSCFTPDMSKDGGSLPAYYYRKDHANLTKLMKGHKEFVERLLVDENNSFGAFVIIKNSGGFTQLAGEEKIQRKAK